MKINCDLGEGDADIDAQLIPLVDQASIACGEHAGDSESIHRCLKLAQEAGTEIGLHPSYPDRENFGRVSLDLSLDQLRASLSKQCENFLEICDKLGVRATYLKAHGALYNDLTSKAGLLEFIENFLEQINAHLDAPLGLILSSQLRQKTQGQTSTPRSINYIYETFADRLYAEDGSLLSRSKENALITDKEKILSQYQQLTTQHSVITAQGSNIKVTADSVCFHGDNPASVTAIQHLRLKS